MMEVINRKNHNGHEIQMWRGTDAEGRRIYAARDADDPHEPIGGLYTQKAALESFDTAI